MANVSEVAIVYLVSSLRRTGPTRQLYNIVRNLDRDQFSPYIFSLSPEPADSMRRSFEALSVPMTCLQCGSGADLMRRSWPAEIEAHIDRSLGKGVVLHTQGIRADVISAWRMQGVSAKVATARNYPFHDYVMKYGRVVGTTAAMLHMRAFKALPWVVACSSSVARRLARHGISAEVIRNGVETSAVVSVDQGDVAKIRERLGLGARECVGVSIGSLSKRKDPVTLIRAVRQLSDPNIRLVFVGEGNLERSCHEEAKGDQRILFAGQVSDVAPYLHIADFFASVALSEGFPNAVLEAIASNLPAILSDIEPHREVVERVNGGVMFVPTGDVGELGHALGRMISNCRERQGDYNCGKPDEALVEISAESMSRTYQALYRRVTYGESL